MDRKYEQCCVRVIKHCQACPEFPLGSRVSNLIGHLLKIYAVHSKSGNASQRSCKQQKTIHSMERKKAAWTISNSMYNWLFSGQQCYFTFLPLKNHKVVASSQYLTWFQIELQRRKSASNQIYSARAEHTEGHTEVQKYFGNFYCTWHCIFSSKPRVFFFFFFLYFSNT